MKSQIKTLAFILLLFGCNKEQELLGDIEITVREVVSVHSIPYNELKIGIFPTESLITKSFGEDDAIVFEKLENGRVKFEGLLPDTYVAGVVRDFQSGSGKLVQVKPGQSIRIELLD
jgi:hypothetical protein